MNTRIMKTLLHERIKNIHDKALLLTLKEIVDSQYMPPARSFLKRLVNSADGGIEAPDPGREIFYRKRSR